ncbi:uncharacterized protein Pyn_13530 [Prunus yedoensis var. nudiflora]|uniref:Armadillo-like repeats domain-containing protein n=1 Tax=Prunus yedoensis var. nudiflora TaxID=2094558 RepID=A0A314YWQ3_PRUYE|nr:uncharacterized protein Pyn_13530 [Prunus yedoensis var. nudiflora]
MAFASATCFSSQLQVLLPRGPSKSLPFVFPSCNTRRVTITFRPLSRTLRAPRPFCVLSAAAKSNSGSNSSEKALDLVEFTGSVSQAIPGPRVGTSSLPWILALPLAYAGLTFVVAFVKTVKKFSSPRQKRKRLVNKNAMLCKSIDDLFHSGADQPKPDALNQLVQKPVINFSDWFGMEDILRKYIRYTLNEKPFNPDVVSNLIQLRKASMFDDSQVAEILNEISRRIVRDKGPVVMDISGYTERGFKRKLAVQALFGKVFYLSEVRD